MPFSLKELSKMLGKQKRPAEGEDFSREDLRVDDLQGLKPGRYRGYRYASTIEIDGKKLATKRTIRCGPNAGFTHEVEISPDGKLEVLHPVKAASAGPGKRPDAVIQLQDDGEIYQPVGINGLLASTEKLLAVNRGIVDADTRDHMAYKRVISPARMLRERIRLDADKTRRSLMRMVTRKRSLQALTPGAFDGYVDGLLNGNPLATPLEEINPLSLLEQARRLSHFGPGGIGSSDAITEDMQAVSADQFGFISTLEGPESEKAGVDVRAAEGAQLGSDGKIYQRFRRKDGNYQWMSPEEVQDLTVRLPD